MQPQQQQSSSSSNITFLPHQQVPPQPQQQRHPSTSVTMAASISHQRTENLPLEKRISPHGLSPQMFTGYEQHSVETLCTLGRELVMELMSRMYIILNQLKLNIKGGDIKQNKTTMHVSDNMEAVQLQLEYSKLVFMALTEIQLRIDLKLTQELGEGRSLIEARPSDDELLRMLSEPEQPIPSMKQEMIDEEREEERESEFPMEQDEKLKQQHGQIDEEVGAKKAKMAAQFEENRQKLIHLDCQMKKLEWLAICSSPSMLSNGNSGAGSSHGIQGRKRFEEGGGMIPAALLRRS